MKQEDIGIIWHDLGSCQLFLPLSDADIEKNYSSGHVCGDDLGKF
jgi:hypothetical protein